MGDNSNVDILCRKLIQKLLASILLIGKDKILKHSILVEGRICLELETDHQEQAEEAKSQFI
jgi:hypothetical protein